MLFQEHSPRSVDDRIGHKGEPPRVEPAEVAAGQSSATGKAEKIENGHPPARKPVEQKAMLPYFFLFIFARFSTLCRVNFVRILYANKSVCRPPFVSKRVFSMKKSCKASD